MQLQLKNKKNKKNYLQLSFGKVGGFSSNLLNEWMDSFLNVYFLFQIFILKNI